MPILAAVSLLEQAETLLSERRLAEAATAYRIAESAGANIDSCSAGQWMIAMLRGDFEAAWQQSDAIRARGSLDPHRFWNGEPLDGRKVIVRSLHGYGDAVQMLRYAPRLNSIAAQVVYEVDPHFLPLVTMFEAVEAAITWQDDAAAHSEWDVQIEITELPYIFRTTVQVLPIANSYLHMPESLIDRAALAMGRSTRPRVGLVWAAGEWNPERSIPLSTLENLVTDPSIEFWSLQGGAASTQAAPWIQQGLLLDATAVCGDGLPALAATIRNLDLVITVDTLAAHLAGALGTPAWVLLQHAADWRWMHARDDSPWYPGIRLFRQKTPGDWMGPVREVQNAIGQWVENFTASAPND